MEEFLIQLKPYLIQLHKIYKIHKSESSSNDDESDQHKKIKKIQKNWVPKITKQGSCNKQTENTIDNIQDNKSCGSSKHIPSG
jgi:hypothetical protein